MPDKTETILFCEMEDEQRNVYEAYRNVYRDKIMGVIEGQGIDKIRSLFEQAERGQAHLSMSVVNLGEVLYVLLRHMDESGARHYVQVLQHVVTMVEAKHSSSVEESGVSLYLGEAAGLVLTIEDGPVLYHAGDTTVFRDMELIRELYAPDVAILPIGGHYTMGPKEAALAIRYLSPKLVLPIHWGTFPPLTGRPEQLAQLVSEPKTIAMVTPGEALPG